MGRPWSPNFEHVVPGDDRGFAVAAWWVNLMRTDLGVDMFFLVAGKLDRVWREGGEFDRDVRVVRNWRKTKGWR